MGLGVVREMDRFMSGLIQPILMRIRKLQERNIFLIYLFIISLLSFGTLIPLLGFYWDDLPFIWFIRYLNAADLVSLEIHRPFTGLLFLMLRPILLYSPIKWQVFNLLNRVILGIASWWFFSNVWTQHKSKVAWVTVLFVLYPGYGHQFISVNNSRHIFAFSLLLFSLAITTISIHKNQRIWLYSFASVILSSASMLMSDYFYMLELIRPVIILYIRSSEQRSPGLLVWSIKLWAPNLLSSIFILYWRFFRIDQLYYSISAPVFTSNTTLNQVLNFLGQISKDLRTVSITAWIETLKVPPLEEIGSKSIILYWLIIFLVLICSLGYFHYIEQLYQEDKHEYKKPLMRGLQTILFGLFVMVLGGIPSWAVGLPISIDGFQSRLTLSMSLGVSLCVGGLLEIIKPRFIRILLLSILLALSSGSHFRNAVRFRWDFERQKSFFWQLTWRVPNLEKGTVILSNDFPFTYESDNSITAIMNWLYTPINISDKMEFMVYDIKTRLGGRIPELQEDHSITHVYRQFGNGRKLIFEGSTSQALVIYHNYPSCLRVIQPSYDKYMRGLSPFVSQALDLSKPELILSGTVGIDPTLEEIYGPEPEADWCYYYQKADLARQLGNWDQVYEAGKDAFNLDYNAHNASEYIIYIEAYGRMKEYSQAISYSRIVLERYPALDRMLCDAWERIESETLLVGEDRQDIEDLMGLLKCP